MIDGIAHSFNPRLLCVYYKRQLKTIMLTSLRIGMRIMEESTKVRLLKSGLVFVFVFLILKTILLISHQKPHHELILNFFKKEKPHASYPSQLKTFKNSDTLTAIVLTVNTVLYCINKDCLKICLLLDTGKEMCWIS